MERQTEAVKYLAYIRNPIKRLYGNQYHEFLLELRAEPNRPEQLSYMAAQAVRIQLHQIYK